MAKSSISTKQSLSIKGILNIDENDIKFEIDESDELISLSSLLQDYNGKEIAINVSFAEDLFVDNA